VKGAIFKNGTLHPFKNGTLQNHVSHLDPFKNGTPVTKQLQDMHVARTVITERGPACACRQRMAVATIFKNGTLHPLTLYPLCNVHVLQLFCDLYRGINVLCCQICVSH
jgi:hypothetical protein